MTTQGHDALRLETPIGALTLVAGADALLEVRFPNDDRRWLGPATGNHWCERAAEQLTEYFEGRRRTFDLPLEPRGTPFQRDVWRALAEIEYGTTMSYGELARRIGRPGSSRAVGAANGRNPIPIVLPCHRVIGASGKLTGFGGGLPTKAALLHLEATLLAQGNP
ncbi:MAG: methylated-DNA--[protein]-cysteine S-methyltransferase [Planctomycetes bacterium]|nr:methylated-DNA--[protein]-cysteine S-methyltransferase [Planctomycetota bacterium]